MLRGAISAVSIAQRDVDDDGTATCWFLYPDRGGEEGGAKAVAEAIMIEDAA